MRRYIYRFVWIEKEFVVTVIIRVIFIDVIFDDLHERGDDEDDESQSHKSHWEHNDVPTQGVQRAREIRCVSERQMGSAAAITTKSIITVEVRLYHLIHSQMVISLVAFRKGFKS